MEAALAKANLTSYEIRGTSILVPRGQEAAYMAALVKEKALPPNFGEQLDAAVSESNFLESSAQRDLRMKNAKQTRLVPGHLRHARNRTGLRALRRRQPARRPFKDKLITATVIIKPAGTSQLEESRVLAVRHLVAGAIAGLKPENVTVSDLNGRTWHGDWQKQNPDGSGPTVQAAAPAELNHRPYGSNRRSRNPPQSRRRPTSRRTPGIG